LSYQTEKLYFVRCLLLMVTIFQLATTFFLKLTTPSTLHHLVVSS